MFKSRARKRRMEQQIQLEAQTLQGLVDAGILMAAADGELHEDEYDAVASVIEGFLDGQVTRRQIRDIIHESVSHLESNGWDAHLDALEQNLKSDELREIALGVAAAVMMADGEYAEGEEDEAYFDIADALDIDHDRAEEIFDDVESSYE